MTANIVRIVEVAIKLTYSISTLLLVYIKNLDLHSAYIYTSIVAQ